MYKLYLDDERIPKFEGWTIVRSYEEFIKVICERGLPCEMSLDHDLGDGVETGFDCVKWMVHRMMYDLRKISINVHSANPVGKDNIEGLIKSWNKFLDSEDGKLL